MAALKGNLKKIIIGLIVVGVVIALLVIFLLPKQKSDEVFNSFSQVITLNLETADKTVVTKDLKTLLNNNLFKGEGINQATKDNFNEYSEFLQISTEMLEELYIGAVCLEDTGKAKNEFNDFKIKADELSESYKNCADYLSIIMSYLNAPNPNAAQLQIRCDQLNLKLLDVCVKYANFNIAVFELYNKILIETLQLNKIMVEDMKDYYTNEVLLNAKVIDEALNS